MRPRRCRPSRDGFSTVEVAIAALLLALAVAPILGLLGTGARRGLRDDLALSAHLRARGALHEALSRVRAGSGLDPGRLVVDDGDGQPVVVEVEPCAGAPGLWLLTARIEGAAGDGTSVSYELRRLAAGPAEAP